MGKILCVNQPITEDVQVSFTIAVIGLFVVAVVVCGPGKAADVPSAVNAAAAVALQVHTSGRRVLHQIQSSQTEGHWKTQSLQ